MHHTVSPIHGAQDVSLIPFTHAPFILFLSRPDTARHNPCTRFDHYCPISYLVLIFCFLMWQFVNADASHGSRFRRLRSQQRDVIPDLPVIRAVPTVQTTDLPGDWQYSRCLAYVFFASLCTCNS